MKFSEGISKLVATFFYIGYLPLIPGTFGSMAGVFIYYLVRNNVFLYAFSVCISMLLGFVFSGKAERAIGIKDARCIVIDEVSGMLVSFMFLPYDIKLVIIGFFLFRALDSLKPCPAGRFQDLKGSIGIMSDDLVAGIYTNIILQLVLRLASLKIS